MHSENQWRFVNTLASTSNESEIHCLAVKVCCSCFFCIETCSSGSEWKWEALALAKKGLSLNNSQKNWNLVPNNLLYYYLWDEPLYDHLILLMASMFLKINQAFMNHVSWVWKRYVGFIIVRQILKKLDALKSSINWLLKRYIQSSFLIIIDWLRFYLCRLLLLHTT